MGFEYLTNVPLKQAQKDYLKLLIENGFAPRTEMISVQQAFGRVTAKPVYANICAPHYAASAMDGVAVNARDTSAATETTPINLKSADFYAFALVICATYCICAMITSGFQAENLKGYFTFLKKQCCQHRLNTAQALLSDAYP